MCEIAILILLHKLWTIYLINFDVLFVFISLQLNIGSEIKHFQDISIIRRKEEKNIVYEITLLLIRLIIISKCASFMSKADRRESVETCLTPSWCCNIFFSYISCWIVTFFLHSLYFHLRLQFFCNTLIGDAEI